MTSFLEDDISGSIHPRANARGFLETVIKLLCLYLAPLDGRIQNLLHFQFNWLRLGR
jgi:hypothetical protein